MDPPSAQLQGVHQSQPPQQETNNPTAASKQPHMATALKQRRKEAAENTFFNTMDVSEVASRPLPNRLNPLARDTKPQIRPDSASNPTEPSSETYFASPLDTPAALQDSIARNATPPTSTSLERPNSSPKHPQPTQRTDSISNLRAISVSNSMSSMHDLPGAATQSTTDHDPGDLNNPTAIQDLSPDRLEKLITQFGGASPNASIASTLIDAPAPFGAPDLSKLLDTVLRQVALEMGVAVQDVVAAGVSNSSTRNAQFTPGASLNLTPAQMTLKIKTLSYTNAELGKKLEAANGATGKLVSRVAELEGEKRAALILIERLRKEVAGLELRAKTAEEAVNVYNRINSMKTCDFADDGDVTLAKTAQLQDTTSKIVNVKLVNTGEVKFGSKTKTAPHKKTNLSSGRYIHDYSSEDDEAVLCSSDADAESDPDPAKITKKVIIDTAKLLAAKKKFDHPSTLSVGLKYYVDREAHLCNENSAINPLTKNIPPSTSMQATSFRPSNNVPRLAHRALDHTNHLSNVLSVQTQQLLSATSPSEYLRILHSQLEGMTASVHECLDALAEERRIRDAWRAKWEKTSWKLKKELARKKRETEEKEGWRFRQSYLVNALEPINHYPGAVNALEGFLETLAATNVAHLEEDSVATSRRIVHTAPAQSLRTEKAMEFFDTGDDHTSAVATSAWHGPTRSSSASVSMAPTNRPRYQTAYSFHNESARPETLVLKQKLGNRSNQRSAVPARIPTAKTEIESESHTDQRLVDIMPYSMSGSHASSLIHEIVCNGGTRKRGVRKPNYSIPAVSPVSPFENPMTKKSARKSSGRYWTTSNSTSA